MNQAAAESFERSFLSASLEAQIAACDGYELAPLFLELFSAAQPVLEAGCGSGRWCGWLGRNGIAADGIDWSPALCDRAAGQLPASRFFACDMACSGLPAESYAGLLALGSIEHTAEGPQKALAEFHRLLRPEGVAVITVPYRGWLRAVCRLATDPLEALKAVGLIRRMAGKPPLQPGACSRAEARRATVPAWHPRLALGLGGWSFYEYEFNARQLDAFLAAAGLAVSRRFVAFAEEGLLHSLGPLAGRWNAARAAVDLTLLGRLLSRMLPISVSGHMLCYVVQKPARSARLNPGNEGTAGG